MLQSYITGRCSTHRVASVCAIFVALAIYRRTDIDNSSKQSKAENVDVFDFSMFLSGKRVPKVCCDTPWDTSVSRRFNKYMQTRAQPSEHCGDLILAAAAEQNPTRTKFLGNPI